MALQGCIGEPDRFTRWYAKRYVLISTSADDIDPTLPAWNELWKQTHGHLKAQYRLCEMCGFISQGKRCKRCYRWAVVMRDAEHEAISIIPAMLAKKEAELLELLSMAQKNAYHEAKKLRNRALAIDQRNDR